MLKLTVKDRSLCQLQVYAPNAVGEYEALVNGVSDALQRVGSTESTIFSALQRIGSTESTIFSEDFNAYFGTNDKT